MKQKGFTLIELLAVIVILAVIALIATPLIMGVITDAKKNAFRDSAYGILKAGEQYIGEVLLKDNNTYLGETIILPNHEKLNYKGEEPVYGELSFSNTGRIALMMHNDAFCALKEINQSEIKITDYKNGECVLKEEVPQDKAPEIVLTTQRYNEDQYAKLTASITSVNPLVEVKYMVGQVDEATVLENGIPMPKEGNLYSVEGLNKNGYYTVYAKDTKGLTAIKNVVIEGLIVLSGDFEDIFVSGNFGELTSSWGQYSRTLNIKTKDNVKIIDARYKKKYTYDDVSEFENDPNYGDKIDHTDHELNFTAQGIWLQCVTIYVKYEYQEEVSPGEYEPRYASKIYKTRFSNVFD